MNAGQARWLSADLHHDGAGVFSSFVLDPQPAGDANPAEPEIKRVDDASVVNGLLSGLRFLARHARDRAAAGGNALVRAQVFPIRPDRPLELGQNRQGFRDILGTSQVMREEPPAERVASLEGLAADGSELAATAYLLATDLFQEFGCAEAPQLTRDGRVRLLYWNPQWRQDAQSWADASGVATTQEILPG